LPVNSAFDNDLNTVVPEKLSVTSAAFPNDAADSISDDENLSSALRTALCHVDLMSFPTILDNYGMNDFGSFSVESMDMYLGSCEMEEEEACIIRESNMLQQASSDYTHTATVTIDNKQTNGHAIQTSGTTTQIENRTHSINSSPRDQTLDSPPAPACDESSKRSRARHKDPTTWKINVRKRQRNSGSSYVSRNGVPTRRRMIKPGCGVKCQKQCHHSVSAVEREEIFHNFWQLGNLSKQREFIARHVTKKSLKPKMSQSTKRSRKSSFHYSFTVGGKTVFVCKLFFLHTLDISERVISTSLGKVTESGHLQPEMRSSPKSRKLPFELRQDVRNHINKFPTVESHYCRKSSEKQYLPQGLNLSEMYRLYVQECMSAGKPAAKKWAYCNIFRSEFNLGFHKPKKDQCDFCAKYRNLDDDDRESLKDKMEEHLRNKNLSREQKAELKEHAKSDRQISVACFDLQQVLLTPQSLSSQLYYRRKLSTFNLSVYDLGTKDGYCYMWHEGIGKRGANNIASCIWKFINFMSERSKKEFHFFTDNCCGQNKNKLIISMYFHAVKTFNVDRICHYYLEKGHTENEGDSMHSTIESAAKSVNIFSPFQWYTVASTAKKSGEKYKVIEMEGQMKNFKGLADVYLKGSQRGIRWSDIKCLKVEKASPNSLFVKDSFGCNDYKEIQFAGKQQVSNVESDHEDSCAELEPLDGFHATGTNNDALPTLESESMVTQAKKNDLLWMCEQLIIPKNYHPFYKALSVCSHTDPQISCETSEVESGGARASRLPSEGWTHSPQLSVAQDETPKAPRTRSQVRR